MKPIDYISMYGIDFFTANKGKTITVKLLSNDSWVFSGYFLGITPVGDVLPLIDGILIKKPQFNLSMMYTDNNGRVLPMKINLLLVDDITDIKFE